MYIFTYYVGKKEVLFSNALTGTYHIYMYCILFYLRNTYMFLSYTLYIIQIALCEGQYRKACQQSFSA